MATPLDFALRAQLRIPGARLEFKVLQKVRILGGVKRVKGKQSSSSSSSVMVETKYIQNDETYPSSKLPNDGRLLDL